MGENAVVRARINEEIKDEASAVLESMGLTVSDAFRMMMIRIAREKALPFEPLVPNKKTIAAIHAARRGEFEGSFSSVDDLLGHLRADD
jgi:DNA-damage-inducible protein J